MYSQSQKSIHSQYQTVNVQNISTYLYIHAGDLVRFSNSISAFDLDGTLHSLFCKKSKGARSIIQYCRCVPTTETRGADVTDYTHSVSPPQLSSRRHREREGGLLDIGEVHCAVLALQKAKKQEKKK